MHNERCPEYKENWVATVILNSNHPAPVEKDPKFNSERIEDMRSIIQKIVTSIDSDGVIIFPGGLVHTGHKVADTIFPLIENKIKDALNISQNHIVVCVGIDGSFDRPLAENPYDMDQIALASDNSGIIAVGRKFFPTDKGESSHIRWVRNYLATEWNKPRIFELNGTRYYLFVCNDIYGPARNPSLYPNPGVDVGLSFIHRFHPRKERNLWQENYFPRFGFGGTSRVWGVPVFGTAIYYRRTIPSDWPSGVNWTLGPDRSNCKYEEIALIPDIRMSVPINEGVAEIRIFQHLKYQEVHGKNQAQTEGKNKITPITRKPIGLKTPKLNSEWREYFKNVIAAFNRINTTPGLGQTYSRKFQCRFSIDGWPIIQRSPTKSIYYEFDDWEERKIVSNGATSEISVEIQFWAETFSEIGKMVEQRKEIIAGKMLGKPRVHWDMKIDPRWYRLQFFFQKLTNADFEIPAESMKILVDETKKIVNDWLRENGYPHYDFFGRNTGN